MKLKFGRLLIKTAVILTAISSLTILQACSQNEDSYTEDRKPNASITVKIDKHNIKAALNDADENKISDLTLLIYTGIFQEEFVQKTIKQGDESEIEGQCMAGNKTIVIIANMGREASKLRHLAYDDLINYDIDSYPERNMVMSAEFSTSLRGGKNLIGYERPKEKGQVVLSKDPIKLVRINAKVELSNADIDLKEGYFKTHYTVHPKKAYLLLSKKNGRLGRLSDEKPRFEFGDEANMIFDHDIYLKGLDQADYTKNTKLASNLNRWGTYSGEGVSFYTFPNHDAAHPTILCVEAEIKDHNGNDLTKSEKEELFESSWTKSKTDATTYYPMIVNHKIDNNYKFEGESKYDGISKNTIYRLKLKITGPGMSRPHHTKPAASLNVLCTIEDWQDIEQSFNW